MPLPLYLLAMAIFTMGTSEFMLAGLLPDIASDLDVPVGTAGTLTSAFAIGMVVGAPLVAGLARNRPGRTSLLGFVLVFSAAHAVGAGTTSFPVLFATRVVAALANAGFLAVALTTAATLVSPDKKGRALAVLLSARRWPRSPESQGDPSSAHCSAGGPRSGRSRLSACPRLSASSREFRGDLRRKERLAGRPCEGNSRNSGVRG